MASALSRLCRFLDVRLTYFTPHAALLPSRDFQVGLGLFQLAIQALICAVCTGAPAELKLTHVAEWPGYIRTARDDLNNMRELVVSGSHAYVASWDGLGIVDFSDPENPVGMGFGEYQGSSGLEMAVEGKLLYQPSSGGFRIFDLSDPADPVLVGWPRGAFGGSAVVLVGDYAYLTAGYSEETFVFYVFDIKTRTNPLLVGELPGSGGGRRLAVGLGYAYVTSTYGVDIIDVRDPTRPLLSGIFETSGPPHDILIEKSTLYVAGQILEVFDLSDPSRPTPAGEATVAAPALDIEVANGRLYAATGYGGIHVFDISTGSKPMPLGSYEIDGGASGLWVQGDQVYVAAGLGGVTLLDYAEAEKPKVVGTYHCNGYGESIKIVGQHAFLLDSLPELRSFDIASPESPALLDTYGAYTSAREITVAGTNAYLLSANSWDGLSTVDISNPAEIKKIKWSHLGFFARALIPKGDYLYAAWSKQQCTDDHPPSCYSYGGIDVFDVHDLSARLGQYSLVNPNRWDDSNVKDMLIVGEHALVLHFAKLVIVQLRESLDPVAIGEVTVYGSRLAAAGDYVYITGPPYSQANFITVVHVQDPSKPVKVGTVETRLPVNGMTVAGKHLFMSSKNLVQVFDLSEPSNPVAVGSVATKGEGEDVAVAGPYVFVADGRWGLQVFRVDSAVSITAKLIENALWVQWPASASNYTLQTAATLTQAQWEPVGAEPVVVEGYNQLTFGVSDSKKFFRLKQR